MGQISTISEESGASISKYRIGREKGWYIPALHNKYLRDTRTATEEIKNICAKWLEKNFGISAKIDKIEILNQEAIDIKIGLIGIKFNFSNSSNAEGQSVAFIEETELKNTLNKRAP